MTATPATTSPSATTWLRRNGPTWCVGSIRSPSIQNRPAPYPAVVVLHGCGGFSSHSAKIADQLGSWGYVALTVDSLGPRGIASHCGGGWFLEQAFDAYAALRYLSQLEFVDPVRVAVLGQSMGGSSAIYAVDRELAA